MKLTTRSPQQQYFSRPADERFENLDSVLKVALDVESRSFSVDVNVKRLLPVVAGEGGGRGIGFQVDGMNGAILCPTQWAFSQHCMTLGAGANVTSFLKRLPVENAVEDLRWLTSQASPVAKKLYLENNGVATLKAETSTDYGRIYSSWVITMLKMIEEQSGGLWTNPPVWGGHNGDKAGSRGGLYYGRGSFFGIIIDGGSIVNAGVAANGKDDLLHRAIIVWNGEVGDRAFNYLMVWFREICGNLMLVGAQVRSEGSIRHNKYAPERFRTDALRDVVEFLKQDPNQKQIQEVVKKAQQYMLPSGDKLTEWLRSQGFTESESEEGIRIAKREEGDARTLWQIHNGMTAQARDLSYADSRLALDRKAGALLNLVA